MADRDNDGSFSDRFGHFMDRENAKPNPDYFAYFLCILAGVWVMVRVSTAFSGQLLSTDRFVIGLMSGLLTISVGYAIYLFLKFILTEFVLTSNDGRAFAVRALETLVFGMILILIDHWIFD